MELGELLIKIKQVASQTKKTFVVFNNHRDAKAFANALEMQGRLAEDAAAVKAPASLLARYPEIVQQAAAARAPHTLVHFLRELAHAFHTWYNAAPFIVDDGATRNARLALAQGVAQVMRNGLALLGASAPESM